MLLVINPKTICTNIQKFCISERKGDLNPHLPYLNTSTCFRLTFVRIIIYNILYSKISTFKKSVTFIIIIEYCFIL